MKWPKIVGILAGLSVLTVFLTNVILVKTVVMGVGLLSENFNKFRTFEISSESIQASRKTEKWSKYLALRLIFPDKEHLMLYDSLLDNSILNEYTRAVELTLSDVNVFPVPKDETGKYEISYENSWQSPRNYGGNRTHEGCDIMPTTTAPGYFPIQSVSDGVVEKIGWLQLGGYRVGIRSEGGTYFYYAHLDSYVYGLEKGSTVKAGQNLGWMGNSGYGKEKTTGKFDTHLHFGIYIPWRGEDISINPYFILKSIEQNRKSFLPKER